MILLLITSALVVHGLGWGIWMFHLHRKFQALNRTFDPRYIAITEARKAGDFAKWDALIQEAELYLRAMQLENADLNKCPFWPLILKGRWNTDYLQEARAAAWKATLAFNVPASKGSEND